MATPGTTERLIDLGPWPTGANNLALETSVPRRSFRRGVNINVSDDGKVLRREGYTQIVDGLTENLFGYGSRGFFVQDGDLYGFEVVDGAESGPVLLYEGLLPFRPLAHCLIEPDIFVSDGENTLRILPDNNVVPWAVPAAPTVSLTPLAEGSLPTGRYHVAVAYKTPSGEEGPLSAWEVVELGEGQGIRIGLMHGSVTGMRTVVYMTKPSGTELLHVATVGQPPAINLMAAPRFGRPPVTQDLEPMPPARFAALWKGRLLVAQDRFVFWSEPNQYGMTNPAYNYLEFAQEVSGLAAVETSEGFFVGQGDRTYYVAGADPADAALATAYPAGMIAGTVHMVPGARLPLDPPPSVPVPMWMASNGVFCVGMMDGSVFPLTESRYAAQTGREGAALFVQQGGQSRFVSTVRDPHENTFAFEDQFTAEVVRNGIS